LRQKLRRSLACSQRWQAPGDACGTASLRGRPCVVGAPATKAAGGSLFGRPLAVDAAPSAPTDAEPLYRTICGIVRKLRSWWWLSETRRLSSSCKLVVGKKALSWCAALVKMRLCACLLRGWRTSVCLVLAVRLQQDSRSEAENRDSAPMAMSPNGRSAQPCSGRVGWLIPPPKHTGVVDFQFIPRALTIRVRLLGVLAPRPPRLLGRWPGRTPVAA
jgi:hypothetical protein